MVVDYRTRVLKISEEDELDTKLTRIPSAKKYKGRHGARPRLVSGAAVLGGRKVLGVSSRGPDTPSLLPDIIRQPSEEEIIKLAPPPKKA